MSLEKRYIDNGIYKLLEQRHNNPADSTVPDKIIRHYKFIGKTYDNNQVKEFSQKVENYDNIAYAEYSQSVNEYLNNDIKFNVDENNNDIFYDSSDNILNTIDTATEEAINAYMNDILYEGLTDNEKNQICNALYYFNSNTTDSGYKDNVYIRLGIKPEEKEKFLKMQYQLNCSTYFNELSDENKNKLIRTSLMPMFNDTILYSNKKYEDVLELVNENIT